MKIEMDDGVYVGTLLVLAVLAIIGMSFLYHIVVAAVGG